MVELCDTVGTVACLYPYLFALAVGLAVAVAAVGLLTLEYIVVQALRMSLSSAWRFAGSHAC